MMENGKTTSSMVRALRSGLMEALTMATIIKVKNTDLASIYGQMEVNTQVLGKMIKYRAKGSTNGVTVVAMRDAGIIMICMALEYKLGQMASNIAETS